MISGQSHWKLYSSQAGDIRSEPLEAILKSSLWYWARASGSCTLVEQVISGQSQSGSFTLVEQVISGQGLWKLYSSLGGDIKSEPLEAIHVLN